jgi:acyl-CoA synthetase (NDP forming)
VTAANLARLLSPRTVAVVGASEQLGMSNNAVRPMLEAGVDVRMVNPRRDEVYGLPAFPSLTAVGEPVDAVLALVNAERSVGVVEEAAQLGCGGVVVAAAGFAEGGADGELLQTRLQAAAAATGLAVVGPNCSGFLNARERVNMFTGGRIELRPGPVAVVSQSGFLVRSALAAAQHRQLGVSIAVSSGNEAVCGLSDYVELFADDEGTAVVCLVVEKVRDPDRFFAAVARAHATGTAVIALKLGRTDAARSIMQSHTGAIADQAWVYDLAFREHGVLRARDMDDLLDQAQLFAQLPRERWRPLRRAAMVTSSGGVAALATDLAEGTDVELPALEDLGPWVRERIPGATTLNPLDMTGFVMTDRAVLTDLFRHYADTEDADLLALCWWLGEGDEAWSRLLLEPFAEVAAEVQAPLLVTPLEGSALGSWTPALRDRGLSVASGVESVYRAMSAMTAFVTHDVSAAARLSSPVELARAGPDHVVDTPAGRIVAFAASMRLLEAAGIEVAPYLVVAPEDDPAVDVSALGERLVVKLADVPHRTELGAVAVGVAPGEVPAQVTRMRRLAEAHGVSATVAVQAMVAGHAEAFAGLEIGSELGSFALLGRGGVLVETAGPVAGRLLPLDAPTARALADEVAGPAAVARLRGQRGWPTERLTATLTGLDALWRSVAGWASSVDINPLIVTDDGLVAVDALVVVAAPGPDAVSDNRVDSGLHSDAETLTPQELR